MTPTEIIEARRARIQQLKAEGRVMTDAMRNKQKRDAKRQQELENLADNVLAGLVTRPKANSNVPVAKSDSNVPVEANSFLSRNVKVDKLALAASEILKELQAN